MKYTNIRYSVMLNDAQYDYLMDKSQEIDRMMCFRTFLKMAVMVQTKVEKKNFSAVLQPGQLMASRVELSKAWQCNRKTATRIVQEFNQMSFLHSEPSNRTTIHTLKCLSEWVTDEGTVENSFFDNNPMVMPIGKQDKGELPQDCQTDVVFLIDAMKIVVNKLNEFPGKANLIQQVNQLKADLSSTQKELDKSNKANNSWQKTNDSLKGEKQDALDELEKQKQEVSRLMALTKTQDERLQSITLKVNDTLQQINAENSPWGRFGVDGKKLAIALETLRWVTSETSNPP